MVASQRSETRARKWERGEEVKVEEEDEEKGEAEGDEDWDAAPHRPRCMDPADPATQNSCPTSTNKNPPAQPGKQRLKKKAVEKKGNQEEGRRESRSNPARVQSARSKAKK
jgi:hypothetical protein